MRKASPVLDGYKLYLEELKLQSPAKWRKVRYYLREMLRTNSL